MQLRWGEAARPGVVHPQRHYLSGAGDDRARPRERESRERTLWSAAVLVALFGRGGLMVGYSA